MISWHESAPDDSLSLVATIEIERANDYHLNINGQISSRKAQSTSVGEILEELGHETEDIAYIRPLLNQIVEEDNSIVVYYSQPNQEIVIETKTVYEDEELIEKEFVYQLIYNLQSGQIAERNLIEEYVIDQSPINPQVIGGQTISSSHRVGDLSDEQRAWLTTAGVDSSDWFYVDYIIFRESRWRYWIWNYQGSSAYGLCQALPASKMSSFGEDYMTNPVTQLKWCNWYAADRYGGWNAAYEFWLANHWW